MKNLLLPPLFLLAIFLLSGCDASSHKTILKGQKALEEGNYQAAVTAFEKAAQRVTLDPVLYYNLATAYYSLGEPALAMNAATNGLAIDPGNERLLKLKAAIAYLKHDWPAAFESLREAAGDNAPGSYILNALATVERANKNYDQARILLLSAMRKDRTYPATYYNLASLYQDHYNLYYPEASDLFETYGLLPGIPERQKNDAAARLTKITKLFAPLPQNNTTARATQLMTEAARYAAARNWTFAERAYVEAKNDPSRSLDAHLALAAFYESRGETAKAYRAYVDASKLPSASSDTLYKAVTLALAQKHFDVADELCSKGMARAPNNLMFYYQMAVIRSEQRRLKDARAYAEYYVRLAPPGTFTSAVDAWAKKLVQ